MYVDPFWAGVAATILAECIALVLLAFVRAKKK